MTRLFPLRLRPALWAAPLVAGFDGPGCGRRACGVASRQGLVYDDRRLVVVHVRCDGCRATQKFYFNLAAETTSTATG